MMWNDIEMNPDRRLVAVVLSVILLFLASVFAAAQTGPKGIKGSLKGFKGKGAGVAAPAKSDGPSEGRLSIRPSGLVPVFEPGVRCPPVASPFASPTRYDGSRRPVDRYGGRHGGIDISLAEGTPLLAFAGGKVVHKGEGRQAEGLYLWLQHSPGDTGLPFWVYSKYQHFREIPSLAIGSNVMAGQRIGMSGRSGTVGGHYGPGGYPHLHLTTIASSSDQYKLVGSLVSTTFPRFFDPVAVYVSGLTDPNGIADLPADRKRVPIPHAAADGSMRPEGARLVWPVPCQGR